jgi:hypothetical protein
MLNRGCCAVILVCSISGCGEPPPRGVTFGAEPQNYSNSRSLLSAPVTPAADSVPDNGRSKLSELRDRYRSDVERLISTSCPKEERLTIRQYALTVFTEMDVIIAYRDVVDEGQLIMLHHAMDSLKQRDQVGLLRRIEG